MKRKIAVLGSTGSIGTQTLEIVRNNGDLEVTALAAGRNVDALERQIREFHPETACLWEEEAAKDLKERVRDLDVRVVWGMEGLMEAAAGGPAQIVVTAVVGMIGIRPTMAAMEAGKDIALQIKRPWSPRATSSCPWRPRRACGFCRWIPSTPRFSSACRAQGEIRRTKFSSPPRADPSGDGTESGFPMSRWRMR